MYTIIVVDDEEELRHAIIKRVEWEKIGFEVVGEAGNGIDALELVEQLEPDLLLTDIRMPFMSGIELARQVREVRPATQIAFLSGYDDFAYAQQAIQYNIISYLLKPISMADLTAELLEIRKKLDHLFEELQAKQKEQTNLNDFVTTLLLDHYQPGSSEEREKRLWRRAESCGLVKSRGIQEEKPSYVVLTTMLLDTQGNNITIRENVHAVDTIARKYLPGIHFYSNRKLVSLLTARRSQFDKYLHILVGDVTQSLERILGCRVLMGVSRAVETLCGCHEAYQEAMEAISYSDGGEMGVHYIADEERFFRSMDMEYLLQMVSQVEGLLKGGEAEELKQTLNQVFEGIRARGASQTMVRYLMMQLFSATCQTVYLSGDGEELNLLQEESYARQMLGFNGTVYEARDQVVRFCLEAQELIVSQRKKGSQTLCEQAVAIIDSQYADPDLSLVEVSSRINVSPNYLSTLIKKYKGKTFTDLLTIRRMEAAKGFLLCTPMKIREISEKCGYSDQHYFSYCFKKYMGISPNALRQKPQETEHSQEGV